MWEKSVIPSRGKLRILDGEASCIRSDTEYTCMKVLYFAFNLVLVKRPGHFKWIGPGYQFRYVSTTLLIMDLGGVEYARCTPGPKLDEMVYEGIHILIGIILDD